MHILAVHNRYQIRGGEEECYEAEVKLLRDKGHFVETYEEHNDRIPLLNKLQLATKTIWSEEVSQNISSLLKKKSFDIVHVQNFFPLISPAVYYAAKNNEVPIIQTLHNYRLLCPNGLFFRQGQVCESCLGKLIPYPGVIHGCYRTSQIASGGVATMLVLHSAMQTWTKTVDKYIALTEFAREKFIEGGLPADKIVVKPHFVSPDPGMGKGNGGYALYVGRLSVEKGLDILLKAWQYLDKKVPLKIVGDGPLADLVVKATKKYPHIEWLGRRPLKEVYQLMGEAMFLVFPSKWYETFGRVAVEAFAKGTPVIASNLGAIAELVEDNKTGLHFRPGDSQDLATKVQSLLEHPTQLNKMRYAVRAEFEAKYTEQKNYSRLIEIYHQLQSKAPGLK